MILPLAEEAKGRCHSCRYLTRADLLAFKVDSGERVAYEFKIARSDLEKELLILQRRLLAGLTCLAAHPKSCSAPSSLSRICK